MRHWLDSARHHLRDNDERFVRVTVAALRGSGPREPGASMLIGRSWQEGTIGGGHLELLATRIAHDMLAQPGDDARCDRFPLGASLGQCCGGIVELWFERLAHDDLAFIEHALERLRNGERLVLASRARSEPRRELLAVADAAVDGHLGTLYAAGSARAWLRRGSHGAPDVLLERIDRPAIPLWIFGAGHVGRALVALLRDLPFAITWIDSRPGVLDDHAHHEIECIETAAPADEVRRAPPDALFVVLTHSHDEDFEICRALLDRPDCAWAGLIGSMPKWRRFVQRFEARGFSAAQIARITCPVGIRGIGSKEPSAIAIGIAAQLLQVSDAAAQTTTRERPAAGAAE